MRRYVLDGNAICDIPSLCAEFARAVEAPNNYFGRDLQSFDDCLFSSAYGLKTPCEVQWCQHELSTASLNAAMLVTYCEAGLSDFSSMTADEAKMLNEGRIWCEKTLEQAQRGERTMFDEIVLAIESVCERSHTRREIRLVLA